MNEEKTSDVMMEITVGYLSNGCKGCPFLGIEEYDIKKRCDSVPIYCIWWLLEQHFKTLEENDRKRG